MMNAGEIIKTQEQKIEELHEKTLVMDKNYDRVKKLHSSEEIEIKALQAIRKTLEEGNVKLEVKKSALISEIGSLENTKSILSIDVKNATKNLASINETIIEAEKKIASDKEEITKDQQKLTSLNENLNEREKSVSQREEITNRKHEKIKELANSLT